MLTLTLMNHTFEIPCEPEDRERLIEAATLIEDRLEQLPSLKGEGKVLMLALNLAYDYLQMKDETVQYTLRLEDQVDSMVTQLASESN
ncbi:cell division protein ZapA [Thiomicrorhabdus sp. zzn3]|uniref:cell division protein ZapA n=1 Tax=Thiomicrorhabdus sp. zzn3 TaxID=3039775 RepID=UPI00243674E8|nr:cell division protein ZapA [Thiomicrorhabdus sp. zzn3]MDG6777752.1 cell division protein ZapA [Thiomicrorhabdus sp. zzn3]